ncbi:glycosyltransferase [Methylocystis heyeri]|uniref:Glycosyltransferase n=1 Tax=Methylocystis heyeri TaxID=391905 RepID=A0A6B8KJP2_9HYPH|nr:glycosyltransferase [Methylocystis heyeri]
MQSHSAKAGEAFLGSRRVSVPTTAGASRAGEAPSTKRVAFFHQNDVFSRQGGIERYLATLLACADGRAALVSAAVTRPVEEYFRVREYGSPRLPQWVRYLAGLFAQRREIAGFLRERQVAVLEFSRPEYLLAGWMFKGRRVVTIHGTGPSPQNRAHYLLHHLCCFLLPIFADRVQVVGRDPSGLPGVVQKLLGRRVTFIEAWYDDRFSPAPLPDLNHSPVRLFYAGRIAPQKNPELLYAIIRRLAEDAPGLFEFRYFGSDYDEFVEAGLGALVADKGFLDAAALAEAIRECHVGLLCSGYGEGSPFIVIETLACGRPFVLSPLPTLVKAYAGLEGISIARGYNVEDFVNELVKLRDEMLQSRIDPAKIAARVADRSQSQATRRLLDSLMDLAR